LSPDVCDPSDGAPCAAVCLPAALTLDDGGALALDAGRCIGCGLCAEACPAAALSLDRGYELAVRDRGSLIVPSGSGPGPRSAPALPSALPRRFRRSIHIRHVDGGSDGAVEQELAALLGPFYDMHRLGLFFTASPRHADVLLVSGPVTTAMADRIRITYEAMPEPRAVVAAGTDACSGGIWSEPEVLGGVDRVLPVDVYIPGDPPSPIGLLHGLLLAAGRVDPAPAPVAGARGGERP
jgi:Ni,Fe-hydrogenase III small subunit/NAD-dependent dihydropyrimidine dehydrogenase PreA subunit